LDQSRADCVRWWIPKAVLWIDGFDIFVYDSDLGTKRKRSIRWSLKDGQKTTARSGPPFIFFHLKIEQVGE
jgi:hypothetical protein